LIKISQLNVYGVDSIDHAHEASFIDSIVYKHLLSV